MFTVSDTFEMTRFSQETKLINVDFKGTCGSVGGSFLNAKCQCLLVPAALISNHAADLMCQKVSSTEQFI